MPTTPSFRAPPIRIHKASGQAYINADGRRIYLGKHDKPQVQQAYHRAVAELLAGGGKLPVPPDTITVKELAARFWMHAEGYYRRPDGTHTGELDNYRAALKPLRELYGDTKAVAFGPRALQAVRERMIDAGWCRTNVNRQIGRIKTIFRWGAEQELVPGTVYHALVAITGLKRGRCAAREREPVKPVPAEHVSAVEKFVSKPVWALIQLQLLCGARAGELLGLRPSDIDRTGKVWSFTPRDHKTAHHGHGRTLYFGPKAQAVLRPFLLRGDDDLLFSPAEAEADRRQRMHERRETPLRRGNRPGTNRKRHPQRPPGEGYDVAAYRRAIARACDQAFPPPEGLAPLEGEPKAAWRNRLSKDDQRRVGAWQKAHRWHPHQLRHSVATELRKEFGIEVARIILGHRSAAITEIYAEVDSVKAQEAMMKVG